MALSRALLPSLFGRDWWDAWDYPSRIFDQHFGMELLDDDLLEPTLYHGFLLRPRTQASISSSGLSEVVSDKEKFQVSLNVKHFKPEEMEVKVGDNYVVIHGKHEEKSDEKGFVSREFTRRYMLPQDVEPETVTSSLSTDGVLLIHAPRKAIEPTPTNEREVPIAVQSSSEKEKN